MDDMISRQAAIDAVDGVDWYHQNQRGEMVHGANSDEHQAWYKADDIYKAIEALPPAQPDIIQCRNCKFASGDSRICMKFGHSPIGELDFCSWAERRTDG